MTVVVNTPLAQNQPIRDDVECSALARMLPTLWLYRVAAKVKRRPLCLGWDLFRRCACACECAVFFSSGMCCWAHRCFFQRRLSVEKSLEKEGSQVHVLEAHWVWVAPRCPLNKITAFTRPLLLLWECNTINKRGGCFFSLSLSLGKNPPPFRYVGTFFSKATHSPIQSLYGPQRWMKGKLSLREYCW